ncbi:PadR family transcriptional regulator [Halobacillus salinarum]|uniref:PadR family transcriptional regulator n=1 Tax=Halobacillus salinarum TaxID=2932257 RepID=A0ABY4EG07_9BACI|nr:PadR family transcriptional regulator [Halobacillus salinarum]UOQ42828.1 PadR family transcriptional regulator [Halobacillus salinarum]
MKTSTRKSPLALAVLSLLIEESMHPYRMQQIMKEREMHAVINIKHRTSIYQTIDRLKRDEAIVIKEKKQEEGKPELTVYQITEKGRSLAHSWIKEMMALPREEFPEFPAALAFIMLLTPEQAADLLDERKSVLEQELEKIKQRILKAEQLGVPRVSLLETEFQQVTLKAEIDWVASIVFELRKGSLYWSEEWLRKILEQMQSHTDNNKHKGV